MSSMHTETPPKVPPEVWPIIMKGLESQRFETAARLREIETTISLMKDTRDRFNRGEGFAFADQSGDSDNSFKKINCNIFDNLNVPEAVLQFFATTRRSATHAEILAALKDGGQKSSAGQHFGVVLFNALVRLQKRNLVARVGRQWGLAGWQTSTGM